MGQRDSIAHKVEILKKVSLFSPLNSLPGALEFLAGKMEESKHPKNETIIHEGDLGMSLFILIKGQVSVFKKTPDGDSYKVAILKSEITPAIGEGGLVESETRSATVICDEECIFLLLKQEKFDEFIEAHPEWSVPILKKMVVGVMNRLKNTNRDLMLLHNALMGEIRG